MAGPGSVISVPVPSVRRIIAGVSVAVGATVIVTLGIGVEGNRVEVDCADGAEVHPARKIVSNIATADVRLHIDIDSPGK
jgi:hypothetical protein